MVLRNPYRLASFSAHYSKRETALIILPFLLKALTDYDLLLILLFSHSNTEPLQYNRNARVCVKLSFFSASEHELPECPGGQRANSWPVPGVGDQQDQGSDSSPALDTGEATS